MRIISGSQKGRRLFTPHSHTIRPASDKVKGAVFNILGSVEDLIILDLFAGTGNIGLEALSRGARFVTFVDFGREALHLIRKNIELCHVQEKSFVINGKIPGCLKRLHGERNEIKNDLIFIDPPYDKNLVNPTLEALFQYKLVDATTGLIIEHSPREKITEENFVVSDERKYGQTCISFLRLK